MDEWQVTFVKNKVFLWGISSDPGEVFTPIERLGKEYRDLYSAGKMNKKRCEIELPTIGNILLVPPSLSLFYNQFDIRKTSTRSFAIQGIEFEDSTIIAQFLSRQKKRGILFGDSYEFFRLCLKFSFSLVSRQRFVPYCQEDRSHFTINLDHAVDDDLFKELIEKAPSSVKPKQSENMEGLVKEIVEYFANLVLFQALKDIDFGLTNKTKTDEWLLGLLKGDMRVDKSIQEGLKAWFSLRKVNHDVGYKLLFKLEDPSIESNVWKVSFHMQSKKDPSYIIHLEGLWGNPNKLPISNIKMHLLSELGLASKLSKAIEKALYQPNPYESHLSESEALGFITNDSFLLKDAGFAMQIPKITSVKMSSFKIKIKFKESPKLTVAGTGLMGNSLFDFDYTIAIGDEELTQEEFRKLSKTKESLVSLNGKWVELNKDDLRRVMDYFEKKKTLSLADTVIINASNELGFAISEITVPKKYEEKINGLFDFNGIRIADLPKAFSGNLRPYQRIGFSWMLFLRNLGFGGILADDMGLGKTIQTIVYLLSASQRPSLIVCPTSVLGNWQRELQKFAPNLSVYLHHGVGREKKKGFLEEIKEKEVILSSYAIVRIDEEIFREVEWEHLILDEAQNIKNPYAKQTLSLSQLKSKSRFCLTGTPIENRLSELWSLMNFVNPGFLSGWKIFRKKFAEPIEIGDDKDKKDLLKRIISPFILRRLKTDEKIIRDLPKKIEIKDRCNLTQEQATLYQAIVDDSLKKIEEEGSEKRRALIMATLIKLKQVCNHPSNYLKDSKGKLHQRSGKVNRLRELVEVILQSSEKCLIFTQYKEMGDLLKIDLESYFDTPVCFLHGQQDQKKRQQLIDCFQSEEVHSPRIFVLSLKAGGLGINLTSANHVIHFDRWWNPAVENQATDRAFRIGQKRNVFVHKFITLGTVEERIDEMIERKLYLSNSLLAKGETAITELNNMQLRELLALRDVCVEG
ncbi:MAG TPA: DEAD/DEAH box helicase [Candidatus Nanoarchaeia archaeon]|nr:DEAD/DEAH box helicase [Candidatus Nanoarchaeia archaeon]